MALLGHAPSAWATDHADAQRLVLDRKADISDQFVWVPSPGQIAVAIMTRPYSARRKRFAPDVLRRVVIRRASIHGTGADVSVDTGDEVVVECVVERGEHRRVDRMRCDAAGLHGVRSAAATIGDESGRWTDGLRLFAGVRRDPFFVDIKATLRPRARDGDRVSLGGRDTITPWYIRGRVLALLVELDVAELFGEATGLFAVFSETEVGGERVDRAGRSEITGFILQKKSGGGELPGEDVRDSWNGERTYALSEGHRPQYAAAMLAGLERLDALDRFEDPRQARTRDAGPGEGPDWPTPHPFTELLLQDAVLVDPSRSCEHNESTFFEIEMASYRGLPPDEDGRRHQTCGGRTLNADVVDSILTLFINGPDRVPPGPPFYGPPGAYTPRRGDGVDRPREPATTTFPYLRPP